MDKYMTGKWLLVSILAVLVLAVSPVTAENYVNWKWGFWFEIPASWEKVNYQLVDRYLAMTDTSLEVFDYEAVFAPTDSWPFNSDAYLVVTFDSANTFSNTETDLILEEIAEAYGADISKMQGAEQLAELKAEEPRIDYDKKCVTVVSQMGFTPETMKRLYLYMQLNDPGMVSLFFYSPDSTYESNKPTFDSIVESLSSENLREAATADSIVFTEIGGGTGISGGSCGLGSIRNILLGAAALIIAFGLLWNFVLAPKMRKKTIHSK